MDPNEATNDAAPEAPETAPESPDTPEGGAFVDEGDPAKFHEVLMKISENPAQAGDDSGAPANPSSEPSEPAKAAEDADPAADQDALSNMTPEELEQTVNEFVEFLAQRGRTAQAEVEPPSEETQAAAQQAQQAQQQQPVINPYYAPLTDDDLIEPEKVNAHLDSRFAAYHAAANQQMVEWIVPFVAMLNEVSNVSYAVAQEYPQLRGREHEIAMLAGKIRASNPTMDYNGVIEGTAKQLMRDEKTKDTLKKMLSKGVKLDGRTSSPPPGQPQGVKRAPNGQFTASEEQDPTSAFVQRMKAAYAANQL